MNKAYADNLKIKEIIASNQLFFIGRIAGIELQIAYNRLDGNLHELPNNVLELENNAGIKLASDKSLDLYIKQLLTSYDHCTHIAEWDQSGQVFERTGKGQLLITQRTSSIPKLDALSLEPYYFKESWMDALKQKRILIIHPFVTTIQKQLHRLNALFPKPWFEGCTFSFIKPPLTLAGNHQNKDWTLHYQECIDRIKQTTEYDIALIAAGGYGMLLADFIFTEQKKSAIYIGGALQLFFGIIGKRWFENKEIMKLVTDDWIRPDPSEKPNQYTKVEKGCYW